MKKFCECKIEWVVYLLFMHTIQFFGCEWNGIAMVLYPESREKKAKEANANAVRK